MSALFLPLVKGEESYNTVLQYCKNLVIIILLERQRKNILVKKYGIPVSALITQGRVNAVPCCKSIISPFSLSAKTSVKHSSSVKPYKIKHV